MPVICFFGRHLVRVAAGDRDGNGWWSQMAFDTIGKGDTTTGQTQEVKLPVVKEELDRLTPEARALMAFLAGPQARAIFVARGFKVE